MAGSLTAFPIPTKTADDLSLGVYDSNTKFITGKSGIGEYIPKSALDTVYEEKANKDTDGTLAANSDTKYPSQKAAKTYIDTSIANAFKENLIINPEFIPAYALAHPSSSYGTNNYINAKWIQCSSNNMTQYAAFNIETRGDILSYVRMRLYTYNSEYKMSIYQFLDYFRTRKIKDNGYCSLSFLHQHNTTGTLNLRYYIIGWSGTANAVPKNIISVFRAQGVAPTFHSNFTVLGSGVVGVTSTWTTTKLENVAVGGSYNNVVVAFITDSDMVDTNKEIRISAVNLQVGSAVTAYQRRENEIEKALIEQFMLYQNFENGLLTGKAHSTNSITVNYRSVKMFKNPSLILSNFSAAPVDITYQNITAGTITSTPTAATLSIATYEKSLSFSLSNISGSPLIANNNYAVTGLTVLPSAIVADVYV